MKKMKAKLRGMEEWVEINYDPLGDERVIRLNVETKDVGRKGVKSRVNQRGREISEKEGEREQSRERKKIDRKRRINSQ